MRKKTKKGLDRADIVRDGEYNESHSHGTLEEKSPNEFAEEIATSRNFLGFQTAENSL